ncbi:MAG: DNA primase [Eubacteriales bacterium]|nr:DNA primase [Eubacteriales bacterium]
MALVSDQDIERIKQANDITEVVAEYVRLDKKSGINLFGLCPFHQEKTPSFSVSSQKQIYYCFSCHKGGDVVRFIMEMEHLNYGEALRFLAKRAGIQIEETKSAYDPNAKLKKRLCKLSNETALYFHKQLYSPEGRRALLYLKERALSPQTIKRFGLGYAPRNRSELWDHLESKGFQPNEIEASGLFREGRNGLYGLFSERLIFPIIDPFAQVLAFGGRRLDENPKSPKYINSPETLIYEKGRQLFGLNLAKRSKADRFLIVEGYMDCISLHQAGFDASLAVLGTALTSNQARLLRRYRSEVVLCFDGDSAGQRANLRSIDILKAAGVSVYILVLPFEKDPDDFIKKHGRERFQALLEKPMNEIEYQLYLAKRNSLDSPRPSLAYGQAAIQVLASIEDRIQRNYYLRQLADELLMSPSELNEEVQRLQQGEASLNLETQTQLSRTTITERDESDIVDEDLADASSELEAIPEALDLLALLLQDPDQIPDSIWTELAEDFPPDYQVLFSELASADPERRQLNDFYKTWYEYRFSTGGERLATAIAERLMRDDLQVKRGKILDKVEELRKNLRLRCYKMERDALARKIARQDFRSQAEETAVKQRYNRINGLINELRLERSIDQ